MSSMKPANVLITPEQRPIILDFGLALNLDEASALSCGFQGTPHYASPEQAAGKPITAASDVFSFGSLMFKILTGQPFRGESMGDVLEAVCADPPPFPRDLAPGVHEDLQAVCLACMALNPVERPSASELVAELERYLAGEPVRFRPALYSDLLRHRLSEHARDIDSWKRQGLISTAEADRLEAIHRGILEDEDHWIVETRTLSPSMTLFFTSTWMVVVASLLLVWQLGDELAPVWRWTVPALATLVLGVVGCHAHRRGERMAASAFLAAAILSVAPSTLALLSHLNLFESRPDDVTQLLGDSFTNHQILIASFLSWGISLATLGSLRMTGFAWTAAAFGLSGYVAFLSTLGWLDQPTKIQALWCLPLVLLTAVGWRFEKMSRPRWAFPYYWTAVIALLVTLDVMASEGPTLQMMGLRKNSEGFLNADRLSAFSFALNGCLFLFLMWIAERTRSLDIRRISRVLEGVALLHLLGPLYLNAKHNAGSDHQAWDVGIYWMITCCLLLIGPRGSRWRIFMGGLVGVAVGSYLLVDLGVLPKRVFIFSVGALGLLLSAGSYWRMLLSNRAEASRREE